MTEMSMATEFRYCCFSDAQDNSMASGAASKPDSNCDGDSNHTVTSSTSSDIEWIIGSLHTLVFTSSASGSDWDGDCLSIIAIPLPTVLLHPSPHSPSPHSFFP